MNAKSQVVLVLALMLVFASSAFAAGERNATLSNLRGDVMVREQGGEWKPAENGIVLKATDEIKTADNATVDVMMDQVAKVKVREKSQMKLSTMDIDSTTGDKFTYLNLAIGKVLVEAEKLKGNSKFEVRTPTSTTGVRGTTFEVAVE